MSAETDSNTIEVHALMHHSTVLVEVLLNPLCHDGACHGHCRENLVDPTDSHKCLCLEGPGLEA